ncbi:hypothetical protein XELAEV_18008365mg [Xenopus laevis]|uniref:glucuronosyltransferase n=1 Tax=Xenopus laevis TaxID=8355 RepID=A0A974I5A7_XENLA|nr:hypothetical protein XELAEV_18008365mg [Xenopus laevis]
MNHLSRQCKMIFNQTSIVNLLKEEKYDLAVVDSFNPCSFLVPEKLGIPFIAVTHPFGFRSSWHSGISSQLSYVPVYQSQLTDHMDFFERVKNVFMYIASAVFERKIHSLFDDVIEDHFTEGSRPSLEELYKKTALWVYITDFTIEFPHPLFPHVLCIGGLLTKPAKPVSQEAIYHGVPMVAIPLFGDQFDNAVRIKVKNLGIFFPLDQLKAEKLAGAIRHITGDESYRKSIKSLSLIQRSQPFPKDQQIVRWLEHIVTVGGTNHLLPYSYQQPLYQQYLLDVILFVCVCVIGACYLTVKLLRLFIQALCSVGKLKQN